MTQDVLIPKMKRLDRSQRRIKIPMLNFVIVVFGTILITAASFIDLNIKHFILPISIFAIKNPTLDDFVFGFHLIPQIPVVLFVCSVLGRKMALTSVILYILAGLFFIPVFGLGGGIKYIFEYGFGYILAYIPAVIIAGLLLKKYTFSRMLGAAFAGVLTIHIIGILYMIILALLKHAGADFIGGWIAAQSGLKIIYDIIASFLLILISKYIHSGLEFILK